MQQSGTVVKAMALGAQGTSPSAVVSSPAVDVQCYQPRIKLVSADAPVEVATAAVPCGWGGWFATSAHVGRAVLTARYDVADDDRALAVGFDR